MKQLISNIFVKKNINSFRNYNSYNKVLLNQIMNITHEEFKVNSKTYRIEKKVKLNDIVYSNIEEVLQRKNQTVHQKTEKFISKQAEKLLNYLDKYENKISQRFPRINKLKTDNKNSIVGNVAKKDRFRLFKFSFFKKNKAILIFLCFVGIFAYIITFYNKVTFSIKFENKEEDEENEKNNDNQSENNLNEENNSTSSNFPGMDAFAKSMMMDKHKLIVKLEKNVQTRLKDVRGIDEVVDEIDQLIRVIKNPLKYTKAGAKIPKGVLLVGKPGTGKTLIAKAIAGDSGVNFISLSGSDFEEMYVGVGASRIKQLFEYARKNTPCIIFIDEIDSLLTKSKRSTEEHSSSRATINQFLTEMDGFKKMSNIFIIGATNHEQDLDSAAIRPGRFDKRIHINAPSSQGRKEIAEYYLNKIKLEKDDNVSPSIISQMTGGFTGAEIQNLINLSGIFTINKSKDKLSLEEITEARDRLLMGISRKYATDIAKRRFMTSVHEMGHTLTCYLNPVCKQTLLKVTIIPSGPALGVTQRVELDDTLMNKEFYLANIDMAMGGHVAEEVIFGKENVTAGCSSDLGKASQIAKKMVYELGMYGDETGYIYYDKGSEVREEKLGDKQKELLNNKVDDILKESHDRVKNTLETNIDHLKNLSRVLFKYNTLDAEEIGYVMEDKLDKITRTEVRGEYHESNKFERS